MERTIAVVVEHARGEIKPITYELLTCAEELARLRPGLIRPVVVGDDVDDLAVSMARNTCLDVIQLVIPGVTEYHGEGFRYALATLFDTFSPLYVCIAHSTKGWDFAPGLAVRIGASCISAVERVFEQDGQICFSRSIHNGKFVADVTPSLERIVFTVEPGMYKRTAAGDNPDGTVDRRTVTVPPMKSRLLRVEEAAAEGSGIADAETIVSAGRGIGKVENLELIQSLAKLFPKSAVAGSRPVIDMGWLEYKRQVGLTGAVVTPKLYIACGISGASQHIVGMRGSGFIVTINSDPHAAICNTADVCIVEDLTTFIPTFMKKRNESVPDNVCVDD